MSTFNPTITTTAWVGGIRDSLSCCGRYRTYLDEEGCGIVMAEVETGVIVDRAPFKEIINGLE